MASARPPDCETKAGGGVGGEAEHAEAVVEAEQHAEHGRAVVHPASTGEHGAVVVDRDGRQILVADHEGTLDVGDLHGLAPSARDGVGGVGVDAGLGRGAVALERLIVDVVRRWRVIADRVGDLDDVEGVELVQQRGHLGAFGEVDEIVEVLVALFLAGACFEAGLLTGQFVDRTRVEQPLDVEPVDAVEHPAARRRDRCPKHCRVRRRRGGCRCPART